MKLKTLKDLNGKDFLRSNLRKEAIKYIKNQQVPKSYKKIEMFWHCQNCLQNKEPSGEMEVGVSKSTSKIIVQCGNCKKLVTEINLAETQNNWIKHFFNITEKDLK